MSDADVFVGLTIRGEFDPESVSERLGIGARTQRARGQLMSHRSGRVAPHAVWALDSGSSVEADTIEPHLEWLLELIEPRAATLSALVSEGAVASADCFWSSTGIGGGPWITAESMGRLSALNLPLVVSFYGADEQEDGPDA